MAVSTLSRHSDDKIARQAYQRRQDELYFYNKNMYEKEKYKQQAEQEQRRAEQAEAEIEKLRQQIAELLANTMA